MFNWQLYKNPEQDLEVYSAATKNSAIEVSHDTKTLWTVMKLATKLDGVELHYSASGECVHPKKFGERETLRFLTDLQKTIADEITGF